MSRCGDLLPAMIRQLRRKISPCTLATYFQYSNISPVSEPAGSGFELLTPNTCCMHARVLKEYKGEGNGMDICCRYSNAVLSGGVAETL